MMMDQVDDTGGQPKLLNMTFFKSWEKGRAEGGRGENIKLPFKTAGSGYSACVSHSSLSLRANLKFLQVYPSHDIATLQRN